MLLRSKSGNPVCGVCEPYNRKSNLDVHFINLVYLWIRAVKTLQVNDRHMYLHKQDGIHLYGGWLSGLSARLTIEWSRVRIPLRPFGNFGNFLYPTLPVSFGRDTKSCWSLLSGVYARGSERSHTGGKCVTCRGLHNSTRSIMST